MKAVVDMNMIDERFAIARKEVNIWIILIIILAVVDIIFGLMRKKMS
jgi:hypothetical protein